MATQWDWYFDTFKAEMVGGQLIAKIDGTATVLGNLNLGQLLLTEAGLALGDPSDQLSDEGAAAEAVVKAARRKRAPAEPAPVEPVVEPADIQLTVTDSVETADSMGG